MTSTAVEAKNMQIISQNDLNGFGNGGEGMALHARNGRRTMFIAHESAPKNFTVVDVTDPRNTSVIAQVDLPHSKVRSNSLSIAGDVLAVAYQVAEPGLQPAGLELFDISNPESPRSVGFFDTSGPYSRGAHFVWFVDGRYAYLSTGMPDFEPHNQLDDQIPVIVDVQDPSKPREVGRWWLPGTRKGDSEAPPERHTRLDAGFKAHNVNVYPERPGRAYVGYLDGGIIILDISDMSKPAMVSRLDYHPPMVGFTHTVLPLFGRQLLAVTDESVRNNAEDYPKMLWFVDASDEKKPMIISSAPMPPVEEWGQRGGRYGAHNIHENLPLETSWKSEDIIVGAFFNCGIRAYDISNPFQPQEIGYIVPPAPSGSPAGAVQMNDLYIDENGLIYGIDRFKGGLYVIEFTP